MPDPREPPVNPNGLLEREWRSFSHRVLDPIGASRIQRAETRRAWYAGAATMFDTVSNLVGPGDEPDEVGAARVEVIHQELRRFAVDLAEGRA
jgi:hypothetical protein